MAFLQGSSYSAAPTKSVSEQIAELTGKGWTVTADGPSGVQLKGPKKMKLLDKLCLIVGVVGAFFNIFIGLFFIVIAVIDFALLTKQETKFIAR